MSENCRRPTAVAKIMILLVESGMIYCGIFVSSRLHCSKENVLTLTCQMFILIVLVVVDSTGSRLDTSSNALSQLCSVMISLLVHFEVSTVPIAVVCVVI